MLSQISTLQDAKLGEWYLIHGICKGSFSLLKTANDFYQPSSKKKIGI